MQIEVYDRVSRKKKYISTGEYILRKQYSDVGHGGLSIVQHPNATAIKARIDKIAFNFLVLLTRRKKTMYLCFS